MAAGGRKVSMSTFRNRECMFCHEQLGATEDYPVNLAFVDHIEGKGACNDQFEQWTINMQTDFKGD